MREAVASPVSDPLGRRTPETLAAAIGSKSTPRADPRASRPEPTARTQRLPGRWWHPARRRRRWPPAAACSGTKRMTETPARVSPSQKIQRARHAWHPAGRQRPRSCPFRILPSACRASWPPRAVRGHEEHGGGVSRAGSQRRDHDSHATVMSTGSRLARLRRSGARPAGPLQLGQHPEPWPRPAAWK